MREVTMNDFYKCRDALEAYRVAHAEATERLNSALTETLTMIEAGQDDEAASKGYAAQADAVLSTAQRGAVLERAIEAFFGERRKSQEKMDAFAERILAVLQSGELGPVFAMQARNGVRFNAAA